MFNRAKAAALAAIICFGVSGGIAGAETVDYTGSSPQTAPPPWHAGTNGANFVYPTIDPATGNIVNIDITGGTNPDKVYGGGSNSVSVTGNTVNFIQGTVNHTIYGGFANSLTGGATNNAVNISAGTTITGTGAGGVSSVYGGYVGDVNGTGSANNNSVTMNGGLLNGMGSVHGGWASQGEVYKNTVNITAGTIGNNTQGGVWGGLSTDGKVYENEVVLTGGTIGDGVQALVYGGTSWTGEATLNKVTIDGATVGNNANAWIYGGYSTNGIATKNTIEYKSGTIASGAGRTGRIYGGYSANGDVSENKAVMSGGSVTWVYGGRANSALAGDATGNIIELSGGTVSSGMYAGYSTGGKATGNVVTMSGGSVTNNIRVGYAHGTGDASYNTATITGGTIGGTVYGGEANGGGNAEYNEILISGASTSIATIYGGYTNTGGNASYNIVKATGGSISNFIIGGSAATAGDTIGNTVTVSNITGTASLMIYGGTTANGAASQNQLSIENANFNEATAGDTSTGGNASSNTLSATGITAQKLTGGLSNAAAAYNNTVNFYSGTLGHTDNEGTLQGGWGYTSAYNNTVNIYGGTIGQGATTPPISATVIGGIGTTGDAYNNQVNIYGGIIGDSSTAANVYGGESSGTGTSVYGNTVTLAGGTVGTGSVTGYIYGGRQSSNTSGDAYENSVIVTGGEADYIYGGLSKSGDASGNKVTVSGGTVNNWIIGGYTESASEASDNVVTLSGTGASLINAQLRGWEGSAATHSGNTLEIHQYNGTAVKSIGNFEIYDFYIPTSLANGGAALTVTDASDISGSVTKVNFVPGGAGLKAGDRITLINDGGALTANNINDSTQARQGIAVIYDLNLYTDANNLYIGVRSGRAAPESKPLAEGQAASLAFLGQGADLLAGLNRWSSYFDMDGQRVGWTPFATVSGGSSRYDSGSHVDVDGVSLVAGLTWNNPLADGLLKVGPFFEFGSGNYDTHNSFSGLGSIAGDGDTKYYGGGLIGRYDLSSGLYFEALFRAGRVENEFNSSDLSRLAGTRTEYDISSTYYGAQAAMGYVWQLNERTNLDFTTRYLWTHQDGKGVTVAGDRFDFDDADSHRWRNGVRLSHKVNEQFTPYIGAAFDYEFDGKADASVYGYNFDAPELKGGTGIGELGFTFKPVADSGLSLDLSVQGYTGVREGVTGNFQLKWEF